MYKECPKNCAKPMLFDCKFDRDNNHIIYECSVCDWHDIEADPFLVSDWIVRVNQALYPIDIVNSLLTDESTVEFLRPRLKGVSLLARKDKSSWEFTTGSNEYLQGEIDRAYQIYLRQMIILAHTYIELILEDFFNSFVSNQPEHLMRLLANEVGSNDRQTSFKKKAIASVNYEDIVDGKPKKKMFQNALNAMSHKDRCLTIKRLVEKSPINRDTPDNFFGKFEDLTKKRNRIVHQNLYHSGDQTISIQNIYDNFMFAINLLCILEKVSEQYKIPYWKDGDCEFNEFI